MLPAQLVFELLVQLFEWNPDELEGDYGLIGHWATFGLYPQL